MKLHELKPADGSKRGRRRVGRGNGSGMGNYATRGMKGQKSRSGGSIKRGFAGGQLSMIKGLPMLRGFTNKFRTEYHPVNISSLNSFESGSTVGLEELQAKGLIKNEKTKIKVLARGTIDIALTVKAHKFSEQAQNAIENAGGKIELL